MNIFEAIAAPVLAATLLVVALLGFRRAVLWWRGRSPRVQITQFTWAAEGEGDREAIWVTSLFRGHLKALQLDGLDPIPDRAPGAPLVEIVEGVGQGVGYGLDLGKAAGRLYRAVVPDSAYEVWATLRPEGDRGGSVSVQLIERAGGNRTLVNFTAKASSWDASARQAAMAVAGALYPRLASRHKGPWATWRKPVPAKLLDLYQGALKHEHEDRFEQAMGEFRATVEMDPLNPHLRLKVAMLEERLELHLDAWFTYWAIVDEKRRKSWKGPQRRIRLLALYRLAIHLWNPKVADQWVKLGGRARTDEHRTALEKLRKELLPALKRDPLFTGSRAKVSGGAVCASSSELMGALAEERLEDGSSTSGPSDTSRGVLLKSFEQNGRSSDRIQKIHEVLQIISLRSLEELKDRMRIRSPKASRQWLGRRARRPPLRTWLLPKEFSLMVVEASELLVRTRIAASIEGRLGERKGRHSLGSIKGEHDKLKKKWPFPDARSPGVKLWLADRREDAWQLHYNAACTIASLLPKESILRDRTETELARWTQAAVAQLEVFAHHAGSARVVAMADWLAFEDPDFADLFRAPDFKLWASRHLGFELGEKRPSHGVDADRYTVLIVQRGAEALAKSWRERAGAGSVPAQRLIGWWREEREIWERIERVFRERRSWRHRLEALEALGRWNAANELTAVDIGHEKRNGRVERRKVPPRFFDEFATRIRPKNKAGAGAVLSWVEERAKEVADAHDERLRERQGDGPIMLTKAERTRAVKAALIWTCLQEDLETALNGTEPDWTKLTNLVEADPDEIGGAKPAEADART